jgi:putative oxidoreductase
MIKKLLFGGVGSSAIGDLGLLILRLGIGLMMALGHGKSKLFADGRFGPPEQLVQGIASMGFPAPTASAWAAALAEFAGGILIAVGLFTRPASFALAFNMAVAAFLAHRADPLFMSGAGAAKEPAVLYLLPCVALMLIGPGRFSLDRLAMRKKKG